MYHEASIAKLSEPQIKKLLKGERVRVKHGSTHKVHLSAEQHKKLMVAHKKGAGITIQADPYQQELLGGSFASRLAERTRKIFAPVAKAFTPQRMHEIGNAFKPLGDELLHSAVSGLKSLAGSSKYASPFASSINQGLDSLEHQGHEAIAGAGLKHKRRGRGEGEGFGDWMKRAKAGVQHAQHRIQEHAHHAQHQLHEHAHHAQHHLQQHAHHAQHHLQQHAQHARHTLGHGVKHRATPKRQGRPRKGGALFPAGYGLEGEGGRAKSAARGRRGHGMIGYGDEC